MKVAVAIDSLKGSLSSMEAAKAIEIGIKRVDSSTEVMLRPLADGGEGTVDALVAGMAGTLCNVEVMGPLNTPITSNYGIVDDLAIIEMASAAGITLVDQAHRNPLKTTTYGVGQMIKDAISKGCRRFIVGIGGSATNDGGIGMLQALGFRFLDNRGNQVALGAQGLKDLVMIDSQNVIPELKECHFKIACDVNNPLCGRLGSSAVYGKQKGATPKMIEQMDKWLADYARLAVKKYPHSDPNIPGTGAAGGLGFAFLTFTNATLESGINIILEETKLEQYIKQADLVITGEGRLDFQTAMGKAPIGVAKLAKRYNKPVIAFAGSVTKDAVECNKQGIDAFFPILRTVTSLDEAMDKQNAANNLSDTVEQVFRLWTIQR